MCNQRKMDLVVCDKKLAIRSLLVLMFAACLTIGSAELPSRCTMPRPRSLSLDCLEKTRRFWYKESEGRCEPIGICSADIPILDQRTADQNYFITMEDCEKGCFVCPRLVAITNGNVSVSENRTAGSTASYTCNHGYNLVGSSTRTCLSSGYWSETEPYCQQVQCEPEVINYGHLSAPKLTVGSTSIYTCNEGYTLIGNATRVCMEDGTWSGSLPLCGRIKIEYDSKDFTNSVLSIPAETLDVVIECKMEPPHQDMTQEWRITNGDNFRFPYKDKNVLHQPTLTYRTLHNIHENNYTCKFGELEATVFLKVSDPIQEPAPPTPLYPLPEWPTMQFTPGQEIAIFCIFEGCPEPDVTWFHYNKSVHPDERRIVDKHLSHGSTICALRIQEANTEDGGEYRCFGKNVEGNATSNPTVVEIKNTSVKRSVDEQSSYSHCNTGSNTVTVVGRVRRSRPQRSEILQSYRIKVSKVLQHSASFSKERKTLTVVLGQDSALQRGTTYILTGHVVDNNLLFVSSDNLIHRHSRELEDSIRSC